MSSASNDVQSGNYSVNVEITEVNNPSVTLVADDNGVYTLKNGTKYSVTITGDGTVSTGFCMLEIKSGTNAGTNAVTKWFTEQIYTDHIDHAENNANEKKAITFEIEIVGGGTLEITSYWGKYNSATVFDGASYVYSDDALTSLGGTVNEPEETTKAEETTAAEETTKAEETTAAEKTTTAEETTALVVTE